MDAGREGRNRTCHGRCYPPATGFEDQLSHQTRPLRVRIPGNLGQLPGGVKGKDDADKTQTAPSRTYDPERGRSESAVNEARLLLLRGLLLRAPYLGKIALFETFQYLGGVRLLPLLRLGEDHLAVDRQFDVASLNHRKLWLHTRGFLNLSSQTGRSGWVASAFAVFYGRLLDLDVVCGDYQGRRQEHSSQNTA